MGKHLEERVLKQNVVIFARDSVYASHIVPFHYLVAIIFLQQLVPKTPCFL